MRWRRFGRRFGGGASRSRPTARSWPSAPPPQQRASSPSSSSSSRPREGAQQAMPDTSAHGGTPRLQPTGLVAAAQTFADVGTQLKSGLVRKSKPAFRPQNSAQQVLVPPQPDGRVLSWPRGTDRFWTRDGRRAALSVPVRRRKSCRSRILSRRPKATTGDSGDGRQRHASPLETASARRTEAQGHTNHASNAASAPTHAALRGRKTVWDVRRAGRARLRATACLSKAQPRRAVLARRTCATTASSFRRGTRPPHTSPDAKGAPSSRLQPRRAHPRFVLHADRLDASAAAEGRGRGRLRRRRDAEGHERGREENAERPFRRHEGHPRRDGAGQQTQPGRGPRRTGQTLGHRQRARSANHQHARQREPVHAFHRRQVAFSAASHARRRLSGERGRHAL